MSSRWLITETRCEWGWLMLNSGTNRLLFLHTHLFSSSYLRALLQECCSGHSQVVPHFRPDSTKPKFKSQHCITALHPDWKSFRLSNETEGDSSGYLVVIWKCANLSVLVAMFVAHCLLVALFWLENDISSWLGPNLGLQMDTLWLQSQSTPATSPLSSYIGMLLF